jgi:hypothetical protein
MPTLIIPKPGLIARAARNRCRNHLRRQGAGRGEQLLETALVAERECSVLLLLHGSGYLAGFTADQVHAPVCLFLDLHARGIDIAAVVAPSGNTIRHRPNGNRPCAENEGTRTGGQSTIDRREWRLDEGILRQAPERRFAIRAPAWSP